MQISNLENETSTLTGYKSSNEKLERETAELRDKINKLQSKLSESKTNANVINNMESTDNSLVARLKEENESAQHQVCWRVIKKNFQGRQLVEMFLSPF